VWQFYQRAFPVDGQGKPKNIARFLTFEPHGLMVETKSNSTALKVEVNVRQLI
jgi:hypothetical protein